MMNNTYNNSITAALQGNFAASYQLLEDCIKGKEPAALVHLNEHFQHEQKTTEHGELFKCFLKALGSENQKAARSQLKHHFASQHVEIGALARIMVVFLKSKESVAENSTEQNPKYLKILSLYEETIKEAEASKRCDLAQNLRKHSDEYMAKVLWEHAIKLDELTMLARASLYSVLEKHSEAYKYYLLSIICIFSNKKVDPGMDLRALNKLAVHKLKKYVETGHGDKASLAALHLANIYMQKKNYEFTNMREASYLLGQLERTSSLSEQLKSYVQAKRIELILSDALHYIPVFGMTYTSPQEMEQKNYQKVKGKILSYINSPSTGLYSKALTRLNLALYAFKKNPLDVVTIEISLQLALSMLANLNRDSYLIPLTHYWNAMVLAKGSKVSEKIALGFEQAAKCPFLKDKVKEMEVLIENNLDINKRKGSGEQVENGDTHPITHDENPLSRGESIEENIQVINIFNDCFLAIPNSNSSGSKVHYIPGLLLDSLQKKCSPTDQMLVSASLTGLMKISKEILMNRPMEAITIDDRGYVNKQKIPNDVASQLLTQGWIKFLNEIDFHMGLNPEFYIRISESVSRLLSSHIENCRKTSRGKLKEQQTAILHAINAAKDCNTLFSKILSYYSPEFVSVVADNYRIAADWIPKNLQFNIFIDALKFFKKTHFCNNLEDPYFPSSSWRYAIKFSLRALEVAEETNLMDVIKEISELAPKKVEDCVKLYKRLADSRVKSQGEQLHDFMFVLVCAILQKRFVGLEDEAEELRKDLDCFTNWQSLCIEIYLNKNEKKTRQPPFSVVTEAERHAIETLGPNYPPFENISIKQSIKAKRKNYVPSSKPQRQPDDRQKMHKTQDLEAKAVAEEMDIPINLNAMSISTIKEVKERAREKEEKKAAKLTKKRNRPKKIVADKIHKTQPTHNSSLPSSKKSIYLKPDILDIFNKLFTPSKNCALAVSEGSFDEHSFRNDVKLTRSEISKLVIALGGEYITSEGKGSHYKAKIPFLDGDRIVLQNKSMTLLNLESISHSQPQEILTPQSQTMTLPQKDKDHLAFYAIKQVRAKLLQLNISPSTVGAESGEAEYPK